MGKVYQASFPNERVQSNFLNFVVIAPMITKFATCMKLDVFYTMVTKRFVTSLLLRNYDVMTCILANTWT